MSFLPPNQQRHSTEGSVSVYTHTYKQTYRVDGGAGAGLAVSILSVTAALGFAVTRLPETILVQRIRHRYTQTEAPFERRAALASSMSTRL